MRAAGIFSHGMAILLSYKWPMKFCKYQGLMIVPLHCLLLISIKDYPITAESLGSHLTALYISLFFGVLLNFSWIVTAIAIVLTSCFTIAFYSLLMNFKDMSCFSSILIIAIECIYICYFYEKRHKI